MNIKFINSNNNSWLKYEGDNCIIWHPKNLNKNILNYMDMPYKNEQPNIFKNKLKNISDHFSFIIISKKFLIAATDIVRTYPIFWSINNHCIYISPQASTIANSNNTKINRKQLLAYQMSGYTIGEDTIWKNIKSLAGAQFIKVNKDLNIKSYFYIKNKIANHKKKPDFKKLLKENILEMLTQTIHKANGRRIIIPLSAGLDSRLIASGLKYMNYKNVECFSYGLKNNFEAKTAKKISETLNYKWKFIESSQLKIKEFYQSEFFQKYFKNNIDGCATPGIQDIYPIHKLKTMNYFTKDDIIINGNSGDFISGGHIPKEAVAWKEITNNIIDEALEIHIKKHYNLWEQLNSNKNQQIIKKLLKNQALSYINYNKNYISAYKILEFLEQNNRQVKFVINLQRIYDFYNINWLLPLWNKEVIEFWSEVPLQEKIDQKLYTDTLNELNLGNVWTKEFTSKPYTSPNWLAPIRVIFKGLHMYAGKIKWHKFEKKYFNYWTDNILGYSMFNYKDIIKNNNEARNSVSWHTLHSEKLLFDNTWQENEK